MLGVFGLILNSLGLILNSRLSGWPAQPYSPGSDDTWVVRYCYEGGTLKRDGRVLDLDAGLAQECRGDLVLSALQSDGADLSRYRPHAYDPTLAGWVPLQPGTRFGDAPHGRIDVQLLQQRDSAEEPSLADADGFFSIGVVGLKSAYNLGTLWRSAYQCGAASIFVVGDRYEPQTSDTVKAWRHVPLINHADWNAFAAAAPFGAMWVAVEFGGEPLEGFEHPERAVYLLGSEDSGLPESVRRACHRCVSLPSVRYESYNLAVAGSIVMYDRLAKQRCQERRQSPRRADRAINK